MAGESGPKLNFVLFPGFAPGHMIPMIDLARTLARHEGITVTILNTPANARRFTGVLDRERKQWGSDIREYMLRFPSAEAGLPEGCENFDSIGLNWDQMVKFLAAVDMLRPQVEAAMSGGIDPPPSCLITEMSPMWAEEIAAEIGIPRVVFNVTSNLNYYYTVKIAESEILGELGPDAEPFVLPGTPHNIPLCRAHYAHIWSENDLLRRSIQKNHERVKASIGMITNSIEELESDYVQELRKMHGLKVWSIARAISLRENDDDNNNDYDDHNKSLFMWLDSQAPKSTIYVSFGSLCKLKVEQMVELALGLESSKRPFILVLGRKDKEVDNAFGDWVESNGFEERNKGRGVLLRGWAPQVRILSHPSVGGSLTHCGWNSATESIFTGVSMLTWPMVADQFFNETSVVEVLGIGMSIGWKWDSEVLLKKDEIKEAIDKFMNEEDEDVIERRRKIEELGRIANLTHQKEGSSYKNIISLIQDVSSFGTAK